MSTVGELCAGNMDLVKCAQRLAELPRNWHAGDRCNSVQQKKRSVFEEVSAILAALDGQVHTWAAAHRYYCAACKNMIALPPCFRDVGSQTANPIVSSN